MGFPPTGFFQPFEPRADLVAAARGDAGDVDRAVAAAAGITAHAFSFLPILVLGLPLLWREGLSLGRVAAVTEEEGSSGSLQEVQP